MKLRVARCGHHWMAAVTIVDNPNRVFTSMCQAVPHPQGHSAHIYSPILLSASFENIHDPGSIVCVVP